MNRKIRHAFLTPSHNCWVMWSDEGSKNITNEGLSHRVFETLVYSLDKLTAEGWTVQNIFVDQGTPSLVMLIMEINPTP